MKYEVLVRMEIDLDLDYDVGLEKYLKQISKIGNILSIKVKDKRKKEIDIFKY